MFNKYLLSDKNTIQINIIVPHYGVFKSEHAIILSYIKFKTFKTSVRCRHLETKSFMCI